MASLSPSGLISLWNPSLRSFVFLAVLFPLSGDGFSMFRGRSLRPFSSSSSFFGRFASFRHRNYATLQAVTDKMSSAIPSNQELVQKRLDVARAKREARMRSSQEQHDRNMRLKCMIHTSHNNSNNTTDGDEYQVPNLYAIKVSVGEELRRELNLNGREKRGRVFVEPNTDGCKTLKGIRCEMHSFFRCLRKSTYLLEGSLPVVAENGSILSSIEIWGDLDSWKIESDEDVLKTFTKADQFFEENDGLLKRPTVLIHVSKDPNAPPPPPPPTYLEGMADPNESPSMTMLSFYAFPPSGIADGDEFALELKRKWKPFNALGRIYVATEGVNAQMSVPTNVLDNFLKCCRSIPELGQWMENGVNVDPVPIPVDDFATAGVPVNGKPAPPFRNLHIRVRNQVVADGLDKGLNWQSAGYDMPPLEWHSKLRTMDQEQEKPILLDCRNTYETDIGKFDGAEPLDTENFRDSWDVLKERLADTPKDAPIMTYCTGGIRCVKVGAYLTQEMGFTNVSRLAGGIIAYDRTLKNEAPTEESMFKGTNFVFDGRLGRAITEDDFGRCVTCGEETSLVSNCLNDNCHKRIIQCETCKTTFHGTCSDACKQRIINGGMLPQKKQGGDPVEGSTTESTDEPLSFDNLDDYSEGHSSPLPSIYKEMEFNTKHYLPSGSHMVSGASQGRLLTQLASMTRSGRVLEIGTFTGYATGCLLEGATNAGKAIGFEGQGTRDSGPYVLSLERDARAINLAVSHLRVMAEYGTGEAGAEAACALRANDNAGVATVDNDISTLTFDDTAGCEVMRVNDALATIEQMAKGQGGVLPAPFDLVFVDADKTRLVEYVEALVATDNVLKKGGLIVVDNVLWKGLVLEASTGEYSAYRDSGDDGSTEYEVVDDAAIKKSRRARKLASKMHTFNSQVVKDPRLEVLVLPMRDGLSIIRKR